MTTSSQPCRCHRLAGINYELPLLPSSCTPPPNTSSWNDLVRATTLASFSPVLMLTACVLQIGDWFQLGFSSRAAAWATPLVCGGPDRVFRQHRHALLAQQIKATDSVLDVGSGDGMYLPYLSKAGKIVCLEPNRAFHDKIRQKGQDLGIHDLEVSADFLEVYQSKNPKQEFDWIVLGNVMCEVSDPRQALDCLDRLLRNPKTTTTTTIGDGDDNCETEPNSSGGKLFFSEHIGSPKGTLLRFVQDWVNPFWLRATCGCNLNRDTLTLIQSRSNWKSFHVEATYGNIQWVVGLAVKVRP